VSLLDAAKNLVVAEEAVRLQRLACCHACAEYRAANDRCLACGCLVRLKAAIKFAECPRGKWATAA